MHLVHAQRDLSLQGKKRVSVLLIAPLTMLSISQSIFNARFPPLAKLVHSHLEDVAKVAIE